jgi:hypothetical protein
MSAATSLRAFRGAAGDVFRRAMTSAASWVMLAGSAACIVGCLVVPLDGPGAVSAVEQVMAGWVLHIAALLLALVLTAGILPGFFAPHAASVLLAKPVPRWLLLVGTFVGALAFVAVHGTLLVVGAWLALGARGGVWDCRFLLCAPLLAMHFAVFFSFSALLASATRNTAACAFGTVLFWLLCWAMNFGRHAAIGTLDPHTLSPTFALTIDAAYWLLPKPLDFQLALADAARGDALTQAAGLGRVVERGAWSPGLSLLASGLCGAALLAAATYDFATADY